jgi:hypothetical protein
MVVPLKSKDAAQPLCIELFEAAACMEPFIADG